jgi:hypothetical protein
VVGVHAAAAAAAAVLLAVAGGHFAERMAVRRLR